MELLEWKEQMTSKCQALPKFRPSATKTKIKKKKKKIRSHNYMY
jgi:hypothetical protein